MRFIQQEKPQQIIPILGSMEKYLIVSGVRISTLIKKNLMVKYAFDVRVVVARTMPPRHPSFYPFLEVGMDLIQRTMAGIPLNCEKATFYFPERWLAVIE